MNSNNKNANVDRHSINIDKEKCHPFTDFISLGVGNKLKRMGFRINPEPLRSDLVLTVAALVTGSTHSPLGE